MIISLKEVLLGGEIGKVSLVFLHQHHMGITDNNFANNQTSVLCIWWI